MTLKTLSSIDISKYVDVNVAREEYDKNGGRKIDILYSLLYNILHVSVIIFSFQCPYGVKYLYNFNNRNK